MRIRQGLGGWDESGELRKDLLKVTRGYVVMNETCDYVMMDQRLICKVIFGQNMLIFVGRDNNNLKIMG